MHSEHIVKTCRRCDVEKPAEDFNRSKKNRDGLASYCRPCEKAHVKAWYERNRVYALEYQRSKRRRDPELYRKRERARWLRSPAVQVSLAARDTPCVDCGIELPPEVMEFDHVRGEKSFNLGGRIRDYDPDEVRAEIEKCDVRCPNCHRMRHYREREQVRDARARIVDEPPQLSLEVENAPSGVRRPG